MSPKSERAKAETDLFMEKKDLKEIQQLIHLGKERGFLTYEEVNDALPDDLTSPEQLDDVLSMFDEMDIEVVSEEEEAAKSTKKKGGAAGAVAPAPSGGEEKPAPDEDDEEEEAPAPTPAAAETLETELGGKSTDPVRLYLRKMGSIALLTREGEVEIAKRIEQGEDGVLRILLKTPVGLKEFLEDRKSVV